LRAFETNISASLFPAFTTSEASVSQTVRRLLRFFAEVISVGQQNVETLIVVLKAGLPDGLFSKQKSRFG
jgi:hypothetical protein